MRIRHIRGHVKLATLVALAFALAWAAAARTDWLAPDASVISKFQDEGQQHSHILEVMGYLTDVYGPRLTNSPNIREAGEYTRGNVGPVWARLVQRTF